MPAALSVRAPALIQMPMAHSVELPEYGPLESLEAKYASPCAWRDAFRLASFRHNWLAFDPIRVPEYKYPENLWVGVGEALMEDMARVNQYAELVWRKWTTEADEQRA